jgi:hypothetical protein
MDNKKNDLDAGKFRRLVEMFHGTIFEGLLEMEEKDYIDSYLTMKPGDVVIGKLNELERRIFSLLMRRFILINDLAEQLGISDGDLGALFTSYAEDDDKSINAFFDNLLVDFKENDQEEYFTDTWVEFMGLMGDHSDLGDILTNLLSSKFDYIEDIDDGSYLIKTGFSIVKTDDLEIEGPKRFLIPIHISPN